MRTIIQTLQKGRERLNVYAFDVDGTLWLGSPLGPITRDKLELCREKGVVGIVSGRADALDIARDLGLDFGYTTVPSKNLLVDIQNQYPDKERYIHVADTYSSQLYAEEAGWQFIYANEFEVDPTTSYLSAGVFPDEGVAPLDVTMKGLLYYLGPGQVPYGIPGRKINLYKRDPVNLRWELIATVTTGEGYSGYEYALTLEKIGVYLFYSEFEGDAEYDPSTSTTQKVTVFREEVPVRRPRPRPGRVIVRLDSDRATFPLGETVTLFGTASLIALVRGIPIPFVTVEARYDETMIDIVRTDLLGRYELNWAPESVGTFLLHTAVYTPILGIKIAESNYITIDVT